jgi:hypothetical protein
MLQINPKTVSLMRAHFKGKVYRIITCCEHPDKNMKSSYNPKLSGRALMNYPSDELGGGGEGGGGRGWGVGLPPSLPLPEVEL